MTDQIENVETEEAFNPYDTITTEGYYNAQAWRLGKDAAKSDKRTPDADPTNNPYNSESEYHRERCWQEGYEGTGISANAFDKQMPSEENGIFLYPTVITVGEERVSTAALVWAYDASSDKQDPPTRPMWSTLPETHRCIHIPNGHAWEAGRKWISTPAIRGTYQKIELPCPPYDFEVNGTELTITAGAFRKTGTKSEWEGVLQTMTEEVENMPDGYDIADDYVNITLSARVTGSITVNATSLLSGNSQLQDDMFAGTEEEYRDAIKEALYDYDWSYETSEMEIDTDYADWEVDETDESDLSTW